MSGVQIPPPRPTISIGRKAQVPLGLSCLRLFEPITRKQHFNCLLKTNFDAQNISDVRKITQNIRTIPQLKPSSFNRTIFAIVLISVAPLQT